MAFASIAGTPVTSASTATGTSFTVNLPTDRQVGELLCIMVTLDGNPTSSITGWSATGGVIAGTTVRAVRWLRTCDGSEGDTVNMTTGATTGFASIAFRITGWTGDSGTGIEQTTLSSSSASPGCPVVTATWGAEDNLFLAFLHWDNGNTVSRTGTPGFFGSPVTVRSTHTGGVGIAMGSASSAVASNTSSQTWALSGSAPFCARTMVVRNGAEPSGSIRSDSGTGRGINRGINRGVA
jgi:hypothetical protein